MSDLETAACYKVLKDGKSPAMKPERKKANVEDEGKQARVDLDAWNTRVAEFKTKLVLRSLRIS